MGSEDFFNSRFAEPACIFTYKDGDIHLEELNDRFLPELWMNIPRQEYIDKVLLKSLDEENLRIFLEAVDRCAKTGQEQEVETWRNMFSNCCSQDKIALRSRLILLENDGNEARIYESVRNISNERQVRRTLEDIEYRYKKTSEQLNIYNWEYDIATKEMRPCYRCMRDLGLPALVTNYPEPAIDAGIIPPDYADMYREMMRKIDEGAPSLEADIPLTVGRVPFRVKYTTEFDENGKPIKAFGSATLISEKELGHIKIDDQVISSLAKEYRCIFLVDFKADTVKPLKKDETLPISEGATQEELLALVNEKLKDATNAQKKLLRDVNAIRTDLLKGCDQREFVFKDEHINRWIRIIFHALEWNEGALDRMLVTSSVIDDLHSRKIDSDRLIAAQKKALEERQGMLLDAIDEANRANTAKTEFFSRMSHDIRTPMSAIMGFSRLALEEMDNKENLADYLDKIITSGDHLMSLINDILDMSQIESGKMEIVASPMKLRYVLKECSDMVRVKMDEKGLTFTVDVDDIGEDVVECDKLRFTQVILNLLSNAYKYTPEGGSVFLEAKHLRENEGNSYEIRIRDTGIGMSQEFRDHIWDAYSREKSEHVLQTQGSGLGMVIVQNIVNMMQGTIELISEPDKGTEFVIRLPLKAVNCEHLHLPESEEKGQDIKTSYEGHTILVVDDTAMNLNLAEKILKKYGFTVIKADSGFAAIKILSESQPGDIDLVLMDILMPVMDGYEATRKIREFENEEIAGIPIIAMSANALASDVQAALNAGMNAHMPKPFRKESLIAKISEYIK